MVVEFEGIIVVEILVEICVFCNFFFCKEIGGKFNEIGKFFDVFVIEKFVYCIVLGFY